jgi:hypothetical protein
VLEQAEGRGLARLLAAIAFMALFHETLTIDFVNIQCRTPNCKSAALARSFGMRDLLQQKFEAVRLDSTASQTYCTYRFSATQFAAVAEQVLRQNLQVATGNSRHMPWQRVRKKHGRWVIIDCKK